MFPEVKVRGGEAAASLRLLLGILLGRIVGVFGSVRDSFVDASVLAGSLKRGSG